MQGFGAQSYARTSAGTKNQGKKGGKSKARKRGRVSVFRTCAAGNHEEGISVNTTKGKGTNKNST